MTNFEAKAVLESINRMFKEKYFSITTVKQCMEITGAVQTKEYKTLRLYHCVDYADMDKETKKQLFEHTLKNVSNVDEFPEIQLVTPSDAVENLLTLETKNTPLLKKLFKV